MHVPHDAQPLNLPVRAQNFQVGHRGRHAAATGAARAPQTDRYVGPGWGIDDLQKHYSRLNLVALRHHYDLVTLMDHMGSSLDHLEVGVRLRDGVRVARKRGPRPPMCIKLWADIEISWTERGFTAK